MGTAGSASAEEIPQAQFSGWARVEVMGHQTHIGYVRTEAYGAAVLFRIDTPDLPEREWVLESPDWSSGRMLPAGSKVKRAARPGVSVLVGAGSIYRIIPCSEAAAMRAIETSQRSELQLVELPPGKTLAAGADDSDDDDESDPYEDEAAETRR